MIRINLLPVREAKKKASVRKQGVFLGIGAAVGLVLAILWNVAVSAQAKSKQAAIARANVELAQLKETRAEVDRYTKEKKEIERKLGVISNLEANRTGRVRILDEIATRIPERMWLEEMTLKGTEISFQGVSIDAEIVAEFLTSLSDSDLFEDVELEETSLKEQNGLKLNVFKVHGRVTSGAPAPPSAAGK